MKKVYAVMLMGFLASHQAFAEEEASWWDKTKQTTVQAWDSTSSTVKGWMSDANESETLQDVKKGAGEVADTLTDKETYKDAWQSTTQTVGEWSDKAAESETYSQIKEGAGEVADTLTDKQTYKDAWQATKDAASSVKQSIENQMESSE